MTAEVLLGLVMVGVDGNWVKGLGRGRVDVVLGVVGVVCCGDISGG